jgi:hypothetical protein
MRPGTRPLSGCDELPLSEIAAAAEHRLTLIGRHRPKRGAKVVAARLGDAGQLIVIELDRGHPEPDAARRLDLTAPNRIDDQVVRDAEQPRDRGTARRIEQLSLLERARERLGHEIERELGLSDTRQHVGANDAEMAIVKGAEVARGTAPQQLGIRRRAQLHSPSTTEPLHV